MSAAATGFCFWTERGWRGVFLTHQVDVNTLTLPAAPRSEPASRRGEVTPRPSRRFAFSPCQPAVGTVGADHRLQTAQTPRRPAQPAAERGAVHAQTAVTHSARGPRGDEWGAGRGRRGELRERPRSPEQPRDGYPTPGVSGAKHVTQSANTAWGLTGRLRSLSDGGGDAEGRRGTPRDAERRQGTPGNAGDEGIPGGDQADGRSLRRLPSLPLGQSAVSLSCWRPRCAALSALRRSVRSAPSAVLADWYRCRRHRSPGQPPVRPR